MKHIKSYSTLLAAVCFVMLLACNKEERQKECLDGKWIYEKAVWQEKLFKKTDIFDDYRYLDVYFTKEGAVTFIDVKDSLVFMGEYFLNEETETYWTDEDGNEIPIIITEMLLSYTDTATKINYQELWDLSRISKNKLKYETELDGKRAYFTLRRQLD